MKLTVRVVHLRKRKQYVLRWTDPETGKSHQDKTDAKTREDALKEAGRLEQQIREGRYDDTGKILWEHARRRFEQEKLVQLRTKTREKYLSVLDDVERHIHPKRLADIDASRVSVYQSKLRSRNLRTATIHSRLGHLKAFLNWCSEMGMLGRMPQIKKPSLRGEGKLMRGRPLTDAEFRRMLEATQTVVQPEAVTHWCHYLEGMWLSGLRRTESLDLFWDQQHALWVDLTGEHPMLRISAEYEKGGQDRRVPITPDFADFLQKTPITERTGKVFKPIGRRGDPIRDPMYVGHVAAQIGKAAAVVVDPRGNRKHATLHDLRRSFAARWADRVNPNVLRELMRHSDISTTLKYYVGQDADRTAEAIWRRYRDDRVR